MPEPPLILLAGIEEILDPPTGRYGDPATSSWQCKLICRVPAVLPLPPEALSDPSGAAAGGGVGGVLGMGGGAARNGGARSGVNTEITGFELLILEYDAEDAEDEHAVPLSGTTVQYECTGLAANAVSVSVLKNAIKETDAASDLDQKKIEFRRFASSVANSGARQDTKTLTGAEVSKLVDPNDEPDADLLKLGANGDIATLKQRSDLRLANRAAKFEADKDDYTEDEFAAWYVAWTHLQLQEQPLWVERLRSNRAYGFRVRALNRVGVSCEASDETLPRVVTGSSSKKHSPKPRSGTAEAAKLDEKTAKLEAPVKYLQYLRPARPFALATDAPVRVPAGRLLPVLQVGRDDASHKDCLP